jgi:RNA polymerase sigma-70 factor (ECF subfamily)
MPSASRCAFSAAIPSDAGASALADDAYDSARPAASAKPHPARFARSDRIGVMLWTGFDGEPGRAAKSRQCSLTVLMSTTKWESAKSERLASAVTPDLRPEVLGDHLDRLYRAAWALCGSREDAEDLVQETCVRVLAKTRVIATDADALPYLLTVLRNTFISSIRSGQRRPRTAPLEDFEARLASPTSASAGTILAAREVFAAIAALPDDQRDVLAAVDVAGLSYAEAAKALDVPTGTVMSRLYRGRERVVQAVGADTA